ncbi:immunity protein [Desulfosporosinus fructosivorans]
MVGSNNIAFNFGLLMILIPIIYFSVFVFAIYFLVSVMKFMKKKIMLDEQRIVQINRLLEYYKSTHEKL